MGLRGEQRKRAVSPAGHRVEGAAGAEPGAPSTRCPAGLTGRFLCSPRNPMGPKPARQGMRGQGSILGHGLCFDLELLRILKFRRLLGTGLEPARLTARASKTRMSAIPSPERERAIGSPISRSAASGETTGYFTAAVGKNRGSRRACVAASKSAASASRVASLQGRPTKDNPTGIPKNSAAGTVTLG